MFNGYNDQGKADQSVMKEVIPLLESIHGYSLAASTRDNFVSSKQLASPESIWSVRYLAPNITNSMDLYYGAWNCLSATRSLVDEFECTDGLPWGESPLTVFVDENLVYTTDGSKKEEIIQEREKLFQNRDRRMSESISQTGLLKFFEPENEVNGPTQKAYDAVNTVRARSEMPALPAGLSKEQMRERIRHEWRVELVLKVCVISR